MSANFWSLNQTFILKYAALSGNSLLVHDYLITFSSELEYIWKAPWTIVKASFLLNRYGNLVGQTVIMLEGIGFLSPHTQDFCKSFCLFSTFFMFFSGESTRLVVAMRSWAIWGCTYRMTSWLIPLYALYLFAVVAVACYFWQHDGVFLPMDGVCLPIIQPYGWLLWFATLVVDSIVLTMVCHSLCKTFKAFQSSSPLVRLLVRDAISFYVATIFNSGFSMICWTMFRQDPRSLLQLVLSFPILTIAGQRLVLNLRKLRARPYTSSYVSRLVDLQLAAMDEERLHSVDGSPPGMGRIEFISRPVDHPV